MVNMTQNKMVESKNIKQFLEFIFHFEIIESIRNGKETFHPISYKNPTLHLQPFHYKKFHKLSFLKKIEGISFSPIIEEELPVLNRIFQNFIFELDFYFTKDKIFNNTICRIKDKNNSKKGFIAYSTVEFLKEDEYFYFYVDNFNSASEQTRYFAKLIQILREKLTL